MSNNLLFEETVDQTSKVPALGHVQVAKCPRCGQEHPNMAILPLDNHERFSHFIMCPKKLQPVLISPVRIS